MGLLHRFAEDLTKTLTAKENMSILHAMCVGYFYLLAISSMYSLIAIAFPVIYRNEEDFYRHVFYSVVIFVNMIGNQILGSIYKSSYTDGVLLPAPPKSWILCLACKQHCPPRAHHCPVCQVCILKRDHHCYFFRTCVGIQNLRYFLPYSFYVGFGSLYCIWQLLSYLNYSYYTVELSASSIFYYTYPGALYSYLWSGEGNINFDKFVCLTVVYGCFMTGFGSSFYFFSELFLLARGQTIYEFGKNIRKFNLGAWKNIKAVLWPWGILYFLIPLPVPTREINAPWGIPKFIKGV